MAILIEAFSLVIRCAAIDERYEGGWTQVWRDIPNATGVTDGELLRVGFMAFADVEEFALLLERRGMVYGRDFMLVEQNDGPALPCAWLETGITTIEGMDGEVAWGRLRGGKEPPDTLRLHVPDGWERPFIGQYRNADDGSLEFLRREGNVEVYRDRETGQVVYAGRTDLRSEPQRSSHRHRRPL